MQLLIEFETLSHYQNVYKGVFPIKVNQLREVVEEIMEPDFACPGLEIRKARPAQIQEFERNPFPRDMIVF